MHDSEATQLMNFRVPTAVGSAFSKICKINNISMTSQIVGFMESYVDEIGQQVVDKVERYRTMDRTLSNALDTINRDGGAQGPPNRLKPSDTFRGMVKHPISGKWMDEKEWRRNR